MGKEKLVQKRKKITPKKAPKPRFPLGALVSFLPLLAETVAEVTTGGSGAEDRFQASVELDSMPIEKAIALCRRHSVGATEISHTLVQIATLGASAFPGQLDQLSAEAIESMLAPKIANLLKPPRARR